MDFTSSYLAEYRLSKTEQRGLTQILAAIAAAPNSCLRLDAVSAIHRELSDSLCTGVRGVATGTSVALLIRGLPIDEDTLAPTPPHWSESPASADRYGAMLLALVTSLGRPFGWPTLQDGALVQDVLPMRGHEDLQSSHASRGELYWHTEDAFHPAPPDYVAFLALRNQGRVATTLADVSINELTARHRNVLRQARFRVFPDPVHLQTHPRAARRAGMYADPTPVPLLFELDHGERVRFDPFFTQACDDDARVALADAYEHVERRLGDVELRSGEALLIDNGRAVHGRRAFEPRYDGSDRWMKKVVLRR